MADKRGDDIRELMVSLNVDNLNVTQYYSDLEVTSIIITVQIS